MSLLTNPIFLQIYSSIKYIHTTHLLLKTYYEKLNLPKNCSAKDIKNSFIKLSKKYHPDVNKQQDSHKKFLEINEAYNVLSNPITRQQYDLRFAPYRQVNPSNEPYIHSRRQSMDPWEDPSFYKNTDKSQDKHYAEAPYYGVEGIPRVSNFTILLLCVAISTIGVFLQVIAIRKSVTFRRERLIRRSHENQQTLDGIKEAAEINGNNLQIELLKKKIDEQNRRD